MAEKIFYTEVRTYILEEPETRWDPPKEVEVFKGVSESKYEMQDTEAVRDLAWEADGAIDKYRWENCDGHEFDPKYRICDKCDFMEPKQ